MSFLGPHAYMSPSVYPDTMRVPTWNYLAVECRVRARMMAGIVGFELEVPELQCKPKLNQHRPESHAALRRAYADGSEAERELVGRMDRAKR